MIAIVSGRRDRFGARLIPAMQAKALSVLAPEFFSRYELYWPDRCEVNGKIFPMSSASDIFASGFADCIFSADNWLERDDLCKFADIRTSALAGYGAQEFAEFVRASTDKNLYFSNPFFVFSSSSDVLDYCHANARSFFSPEISRQLSLVDDFLRNNFSDQPFAVLHCRRGDVRDYLVEEQLWPDYLGRVCTRYDLVNCLQKICFGNVLVLSDDGNFLENEKSLSDLDLSKFNLLCEADLQRNGLGGSEVVLIDLISKSSMLFQSRSAFSDAAALFAPLKRVSFASLTEEMQQLPPFDFEDSDNLLFHARSALWAGRSPKCHFAVHEYLEAFMREIVLNDKSFVFHLDLFGTPGVRALMSRVDSSSILRKKVLQLLSDLDRFPERCSMLLPGVWRRWYRQIAGVFRAHYWSESGQ